MQHVKAGTFWNPATKSKNESGNLVLNKSYVRLTCPTSNSCSFSLFIYLMQIELHILCLRWSATANVTVDRIHMTSECMPRVRGRRWNSKTELHEMNSLWWTAFAWHEWHETALKFWLNFWLSLDMWSPNSFDDTNDLMKNDRSLEAETTF